MLQKLYRDKRKREWCCHSWMAEYVDPYLNDLSLKGYKDTTLRHYSGDLIRFGYFIERYSKPKITRFLDYVEEFLPKYPGSKWVRRTLRTTINRFVEYLQFEGIISLPKSASFQGANAKLVEQFVKFQCEHRGVCLEYSKNIRTFCTVFLEYLQKKGITKLGILKPDTILEFITMEGRHYTRRTMSSRCSMLRIFLSYLYRRSVIRNDLATVVVAPRRYKQETCPRFLTESEIRAVLSVADRNTPRGRRNYAMMLMLATYGLRGIEVIRLKLEDIDWNDNELHIRTRKAGNNSVYPLSVSVGEAILNYLQEDRPKSNDRHVFLSVKAPYRPLVYTYAIGYQVRKYMASAGINVNRPGTHTFRYSCAQRLLDCGTPLKTIGDYLGHLMPETTQGYTKIAINHLREVALGDGEELL